MYRSLFSAPNLRSNAMAHATMSASGGPILARLERWFAESRRLSREIRMQAEMERKLRGVDDHLLRDMGLKWTGSRLERMNREEMS
jgi:hypothetical protein